MQGSLSQSTSLRLRASGQVKVLCQGNRLGPIPYLGLNLQRMISRELTVTNATSVQPDYKEAAVTEIKAAVSDLTTAVADKVHAVSDTVQDLTAEAEQQQKRLERKLQREREQMTYKMSAIAASAGVTSLGVAAVYYRFWWHMKEMGGEFPTGEAFCTFFLTIGGVIGMEMWARWAHKALWHDFQPGWSLHKSHHEPRLGPFEANDIYAIINAVPAMALCAYGFLTPTLWGGVCFGLGLGITLFGMSYMFVHDGLVHKRFPVGPIADVPYLKRVAVAHRLHHSEKYGGVPWGLFLGPQELEAVGAKEELDRLVADLDMSKKRT